MDTILLLVQIAGLAFLIIYVVKTWEMASATRRAAEATERSVSEMREARDQETAPYVVVYFDVVSGSNLIYLVVKNIGRSIAEKIRLVFTPPLCTSGIVRIEELSLIKDGIESMPPGYEVRTLFDPAPKYFGNAALPLKYTVKISYFGGIETHERTIEQVLDLAMHKGLVYVDRKDVHDLVKNLEALTRVSDKIETAVDSISVILKKGVLIRNPTIMTTRLESGMINWREALLAKADEFENLWLVLNKEDRVYGSTLDELQAGAFLLRDQFLALLSNRPSDADADLVGNGLEISRRLHEIGQMEFYIDGGESIRRFNELGDKTLQEMRKLKEAISSSLAHDGT